MVRRKPAPVTEGEAKPAPPAASSSPAGDGPAAQTGDDKAVETPVPQDAVTSPPAEETAGVESDQPRPVGEPARGPQPPLAMQDDRPSSAPAEASAATPGEPGQSEEGSFFDKLTDFLKTNLEPDPEPAAQTGRAASEAAVTKAETMKTPVETAAVEPAVPAPTADTAVVKSAPAVEKAEAPKTAVAADTTTDPAPANPVEAPETDIAAEATKSLNESLADLGEMFGKVGDFFTEGIMGNPELPPATVTAENGGTAEQDEPAGDGGDGAGKTEGVPAPQRVPAPVVKKEVPEKLPPPRPAAPEVAARTVGEASNAPQSPRAPQPETVPVQPVRVVGAQDMVLGSTGWLGKRLIYNEAAAAACVEKAAWKSRFCIEVIDWPEPMQAVFQGSRGVFGAGKAIVRYIGDVASQYHVVFPTQAYKQVAAHFTERFGPPHETPDVWATLLGEPKRFNNTLRWHARDISGPGMVLEVREIDDLRWSAPPDVKSGVVRLHHKGAGTVFEHLTTADLLLIQVQKGAQSAVAQPAQPAAASPANPN